LPAGDAGKKSWEKTTESKTVGTRSWSRGHHTRRGKKNTLEQKLEKYRMEKKRIERKKTEVSEGDHLNTQGRGSKHLRRKFELLCDAKGEAFFLD